MRILKPNSLDKSRVIQFCDECRTTFDVKKDKLFDECPQCNGDIEAMYGNSYEEEVDDGFIPDKNFKERYNQAKKNIKNAQKKVMNKSCCGKSKK
jgi:hypothetical protein